MISINKQVTTDDMGTHMQPSAHGGGDGSDVNGQERFPGGSH